MFCSPLITDILVFQNQEVPSVSSNAPIIKHFLVLTKQRNIRVLARKNLTFLLHREQSGQGGVLEIRGLKLYINEIKGTEIWGELRGVKIIWKKKANDFH